MAGQGKAPGAWTMPAGGRFGHGFLSIGPALQGCGRRCDSGRRRNRGFFETDPAFDHDIRRTADQHKMLDIVAADQHDAAPGVDDSSIDDGQALGPFASRDGQERRDGALTQIFQHARIGNQGEPDDRDRYDEIRRRLPIQEVHLSPTPNRTPMGLVPSPAQVAR